MRLDGVDASAAAAAVAPYQYRNATVTLLMGQDGEPQVQERDCV